LSKWPTLLSLVYSTLGLSTYRFKEFPICDDDYIGLNGVNVKKVIEYLWGHIDDVWNSVEKSTVVVDN
jgi:hypothetical protein